MTDLEVQPPDEQSRQLWSSVADLAALLPGEWVLIGGLMVQLHALESGIDDVRATIDGHRPSPSSFNAAPAPPA